MSVNPLIFNISRASLHDGPGIRTVIYFKGCNLRCKWCHNPEGLGIFREVSYSPTKCIHCGTCVSLCPHIHEDMTIDRTACTNCGTCAENCPTGALSMIGDEMSSDQLLDVILKDKAYYEQSGGGVTLSGGECLLYPEFVSELLAKCKLNHIHTIVESAFCVPWSHIERVMGNVDLFFVDIKHMNSAIHQEYTGVGNELVLENIVKLSALTKNIQIRVPLIPGVNDDSENKMRTEEFVRKLGLGKIEYLKYNNLAKAKYAAVGKTYTDFLQSDE